MVCLIKLSYRAISDQKLTELYNDIYNAIYNAIKALVSAEFLICREVLSEMKTHIQDQLEFWGSTNQELTNSLE